MDFCFSLQVKATKRKEDAVRIVILLIICVFLIIPLALMNHGDGLDSVILSTGKSQHVILPTGSSLHNDTGKLSETSAKEEARQRRHQLIIEVADALRR